MIYEVLEGSFHRCNSPVNQSDKVLYIVLNAPAVGNFLRFDFF